MSNPIEQWREDRRKMSEAIAEDLKQRQNEQMKAEARGRYVGAGGTDQEFETAWPGIRERILADEAAGKGESQ